MFTPILAWMTYMAATIVEPTFVFPLGRLPPGPTQIAFGAVAALGAAFVGWSTWLRYVRRPQVVLADDRVELPVGEFGTTSLTLRRGSVRKVALLHGAAGWRRLRVDHDGGTLFVEAARLPDEASFDAVHRALEALGPDGQPRRAHARWAPTATTSQNPEAGMASPPATPIATSARPGPTGSARACRSATAWSRRGAAAGRCSRGPELRHPRCVRLDRAGVAVAHDRHERLGVDAQARSSCRTPMAVSAAPCVIRIRHLVYGGRWGRAPRSGRTCTDLARPHRPRDRHRPVGHREHELAVPDLDPQPSVVDQAMMDRTQSAQVVLAVASPEALRPHVVHVHPHPVATPRHPAPVAIPVQHGAPPRGRDGVRLVAAGRTVPHLHDLRVAHGLGGDRLLDLCIHPRRRPALRAALDHHPVPLGAGRLLAGCVRLDRAPAQLGCPRVNAGSRRGGPTDVRRPPSPQGSVEVASQGDDGEDARPSELPHHRAQGASALARTLACGGPLARSAGRALGWHPDASAGRVLAAALLHEDPEVRIGAVQGLLARADGAAIRSAAEDPDANVRWYVENALAELERR